MRIGMRRKLKTANRTMIGGALLCVLVLRCAFAFAGPVLDVAPQSAGDQADFETGMRAAADGNLLRAQTIFETLRRIEPHAPQAYIGLAEVATRAGRLSEGCSGRGCVWGLAAIEGSLMKNLSYGLVGRPFSGSLGGGIAG